MINDKDDKGKKEREIETMINDKDDKGMIKIFLRPTP